MDIYLAIILGIIQGIVEWFPMSSEGIISLILINFFDTSLKEAVYLAIWLHTGTLIAAIVFFRTLIKEMMQNLLACIRGSRHSRKICKLTGFLGISSFLTALVGIPIILFGLDKVDMPGNIATAIIGVLLIITGVLQLLKLKVREASRNLQLTDALPVGLVQGFSALPGISRSGITVSSLLFLGYNPKSTLRLSFLMSIPVVFGAEIGIVLLNKLTFDMNAFWALTSSFLVGISTIKFFITLAEKVDFGYFCILIGVLSCFVLFL